MEHEDPGMRRKRDAVRGDKPVQFSMFDPIVAYDAISTNWVNVPEVAKLGIQAAHKKIGLARQERSELQVALDNLQKQLRGMQEHNVQQIQAIKDRIDILNKTTKRKKKYRKSSACPTEQELKEFRSNGSTTLSPPAAASRSRPSSGRDSFVPVHARRSSVKGHSSRHLELAEQVSEASSDESSVGVSAEQQTLLDQIEPLKEQTLELRTGLKKEGQRRDVLLKRIERVEEQLSQLDARVKDELSPRALSLLFRQIILNELPATVDNSVSQTFEVFKKLTDSIERRLEDDAWRQSIQEVQERLRQLEELAQRQIDREASSELYAEVNSLRSSFARSEEIGMPTVHLAPAVAGPLAEASLDFGLRRPEGRVKAPLADNSPMQAVRSVWEPKQGSESFMGTSSPTTSRQPVRSDDEIPLGGLAEHYSDLDASGPKVGMHAQPSEDALLRRDKRSSLLQSQVNEQAEQLRVAQDQLSSLAETLQEQAAQSSSKEEMRRLHEAQSAALAELRGNFERTMDTMESNVNQQMLQTQRRLQTMDATMSRAQENLIEKTEGRFLEFMSEAESERARLWHQMSVLFPRFLANESKAPMTMSEARVFAIDVRLDSVEDGIVKLMSRDEDEKKRSGRRSSSCLRPEDPQEQSDPLPAMEKLKAPQAFQKDRAPHQLPTQGRPSLGGKLRTALLLASPRRSAAAPARNASPELPGRVSHIPDLGAEVSSPELEGLELQVEFGPTPRATCLSQPLAGLDLSMDDALLEVMGEARNDAEDAKLVRSLNQKGKRWRMGDAAVGRVILGQETRPGTARVRGQWLGTLCRDTEA